MFFSGEFLGAFAYRLYSTSSVHSGRDTGGPPRKLSPEEFPEEVYIRSDQRRQTRQSADPRGLNAILDRTARGFRQAKRKIKPDRDAVSEKWRPARESIHNHQVESINSLLSPRPAALIREFSGRAGAPAQTVRPAARPAAQAIAVRSHSTKAKAGPGPAFSFQELVARL